MIMKIQNEMGWCPVCGGLMKPDAAEIQGDYYNSPYSCDDCEIDVTYSTPRWLVGVEDKTEGEIEITITPYAS